jgi:phosphoribosylanthranilate isomerase
VAHVTHRSTAKFVGVFVNADPEEINRVARLCRLDYAQLSGSESDEIVNALDLPAIQVFQVGLEGIDDALAHRVEGSRAELVLLDTARPDSHGGTGKTFPWTGASRIARPFLLAGGLRSENVADAVKAMDPWGLDVSSGVETEGDKDPAKIRNFIAQVRAVTA